MAYIYAYFIIGGVVAMFVTGTCIAYFSVCMQKRLLSVMPELATLFIACCILWPFVVYCTIGGDDIFPSRKPESSEEWEDGDDTYIG